MKNKSDKNILGKARLISHILVVSVMLCVQSIIDRLEQMNSIDAL